MHKVLRARLHIRFPSLITLDAWQMDVNEAAAVLSGRFLLGALNQGCQSDCIHIIN